MSSRSTYRASAGSSKPLGVRYRFEYFATAIDSFLSARGIDRVGIASHDLGGPIGLYWASRRPGRTTRVALLNTFVYPDFSPALTEFVRALTTAAGRARLTSPEGLADLMRSGLADPRSLSPETLAAVQLPFETEAARRALVKAALGLEPEGFAEIERSLPSLRMPFRLVYGERDRVLPDVAETMARVKRDLPHAVVTALPDCGHFLQEDAPEEVGELLAGFFAEQEGSARGSS